ncbi:MAG: trigger factor [Rickettsiales bacterium]|nr:trigger factor [Rickettsiales bacterium]
MFITELKKDKTEYHAKVTISIHDINKDIEINLAQISKTAKMDGFRVGKVPLSVLKKKYAASIRADIANKKIQEASKQVIANNKLNAAFEPIVEGLKNDEGKDIEFVLRFELVPEITLPDFKKISIEKPIADVSEKDINEELDQIAKFSKTYEKEIKTKAKMGDQVTIDAVGYLDGKAFDGGKVTAHKLVLGSNTFIPGFEDQLVGSKTGDDVVVKVTFPKEYHAKELAGKASEFKVKVLAVHQEESPKIDDEFAKKFKCENVKELKSQIGKNIKAKYDDSIMVLMKMKLFDQLEEALKFDVPPSLLEREKIILLSQTDEMGEDDEMKKMSKKEKDKYFSNLATRRVRIGLMLAEYVKIKGIVIGEEDIRQAMLTQARKYPGQEKAVIDYFQKNPQAIANLKGPILEDKGVKALFDKEITIKEKSYSLDKLEKLLDKEIRD